MHLSTQLLALATALSTLVVASPAAAAPSPPRSPRDDCPRYSPFDGANAIASLYLGAGTDKSDQMGRMIHQVIGLLAGPSPMCQAWDIYVHCDEDGDHWSKRDVEQRSDDKCDSYCEKLRPYKHCTVKCKDKC
ncbi:MAG: hypothetical protein FRX48_09269 [Lasallia pustulata]|uniref:Uncharacterized protein n=1 Tax=Lasallia pustulata TaxID=136370 RepID=A0A5M8PCK1_9LECA|nr:MAG: hypothetical protein FRX48_09269 [Lasallia pustulata]